MQLNVMIMWNIFRKKISMCHIISSLESGQKFSFIYLCNFETGAFHYKTNLENWSKPRLILLNFSYQLKKLLSYVCDKFWPVSEKKIE